MRAISHTSELKNAQTNENVIYHLLLISQKPFKYDYM